MNLASPSTPRTKPVPTVTTVTTAQPTRSRWSLALLAAGLMLIALNMRPGIAAIGPALLEIRTDLGLSAEVASFLTTIPVFAFGVFAFFTPVLVRKLGTHRLLGLTMLVLAAGIALRLAPSMLWIFAGTVCIGAAIAVTNVVMPAAIKQDFASRSALMMGFYSTAMFVGASAASGLTAPLAVAAGGWRPAVGVWALPALAAFLLFLPQMIRPREVGADPAARTTDTTPASSASRATPRLRDLFTDRVAIAITILMGTQSLSYYVSLTWFPALLQDFGVDKNTAGLLIAFTALPGLVASLFTPMIAQRVRPTWVPFVVAALLPASAYLGLAFSPLHGTYLWMTLLGLGQGAAIGLALTYIVWRSPDVQTTALVSTMSQGFGYLLAGLGPILFGALHSATGSWDAPLWLLGGILVLQVVAGIAVSRPRMVLAGPVA